MTLDIVSIIAVAGTFAWFITVQVTILSGLVRRGQYWRGLAALLLPVLAPYWAFTEGMTLRGWMWLAGAASYGASLALTLWRS